MAGVEERHVGPPCGFTISMTSHNGGFRPANPFRLKAFPVNYGIG